MSDGITDGIRAARAYDKWKQEHADEIEQNWKDGRILFDLGTRHLVSRMEPDLQDIVRAAAIEKIMSVTGNSRSDIEKNFSKYRLTARVSIVFEKVESFEGGAIDKRKDRNRSVLWEQDDEEDFTIY